MFRERAFSGVDKSTNEDLEEIGKKIAAQCEGVPPAVKIIGSLLKFKSRKQEWEDVLNGEIWKLDLEHRDVFVPFTIELL